MYEVWVGLHAAVRVPRWDRQARPGFRHSHHEDNPAAQATFLWHVESLVRNMSEIVNPFMDLSVDLLVLDTIVVADCTIVESVQMIEKIGQQRCDSFYQDRLIVLTKQLNDTITEAKLPLFQTCAQR